jgi:hypothetical protein
MSLTGAVVDVASTLPDKRIATAVRIAVLNIGLPPLFDGEGC